MVHNNHHILTVMSGAFRVYLIGTIHLCAAGTRAGTVSVPQPVPY